MKLTIKKKPLKKVNASHWPPTQIACYQTPKINEITRNRYIFIINGRLSLGSNPKPNSTINHAQQRTSTEARQHKRISTFPIHPIDGTKSSIDVCQAGAFPLETCVRNERAFNRSRTVIPTTVYLGTDLRGTSVSPTPIMRMYR